MVVEGRVTRTFANGDNGRPISKRKRAMKTKTNVKAGYEWIKDSF